MLELIKGAPAEVNEALVKAVAARTAWEYIDKTDKETKKTILENNIFIKEKTGERITETNSDFMMSTEDFEKYCTLVYNLNCKKGLDSGGAGLTFWSAHKAVYDTEENLIDVITKDIPDYTPEIIQDIKSNNSLRDKFMNIFGL